MMPDRPKLAKFQHFWNDCVSVQSDMGLGIASTTFFDDTYKRKATEGNGHS